MTLSNLCWMKRELPRPIAGAESKEILRNSTANRTVHEQLDSLGLNLGCTMCEGHDHQEFT